MPTKPLASALNGKDHITVLADIIAERLDSLHAVVGENRIYLIDSVNAGALYWLAKQFDVLGYKGWWQANTEEKRRALIKRAVELHRYKGTPWAVKEAIKTLGFTEVVLQERIGLNDGYYNGLFTHDGGHTYGSGGTGEWATFRVVLNLDEYNEIIGDGSLTELTALINEYKNVRSHLVGIIFQVNFEDGMEMEDATDGGQFIEDTDYLTGFTLTYDGTAGYDGEYEYDSTGDTLTISGEEVEGFTMQFASGSGFVRLFLDQPCTVDWGDGLIDPHAGGVINHIYIAPGTFTITVSDYVDMTHIEMGDEDVTTDLPLAISGIPSTVNQLNLRNFQGTALDLSAYSSLSQIYINSIGSTESLLEDITIPSSANLILVSVTANLTVASVNHILTTLDAAGEFNGAVLLTQVTATPPTGAGLTAKASLIAKGWTVFTD